MRKIIPAVAAGVTALAVAGATFGYASLNKDVTLSVDGQARELTTTSGTVGELLSDQGVTVGEHDVVAPGVGTAVVDGTRVAVQYGRQVQVRVDGRSRSFWTTATTVGDALAALDLDRADSKLSTSRSSAIGRQGLSFDLATAKTVTVTAAGKDRRLRTTAATVGAALDEAKIDVDGDDEVSRPPSSRLADGDEVTVVDVEVDRVTKKTQVDFTTVRKNTDKLDRGKTRTSTEGRDGVRTTVFKVVRHDGTVERKTELRSRITRDPRTKVVLVGTRDLEPVKQKSVEKKSTEQKSSGTSGSSGAASGNTVWDRLAKCESGGNWAINTGNGFYGGLQFTLSTWRANGGSGMPHKASRSQQIAVAKRVQASQGWGAWPACTSKLGIR